MHRDIGVWIGCGAGKWSSSVAGPEVAVFGLGVAFVFVGQERFPALVVEVDFVEFVEIIRVVARRGPLGDAVLQAGCIAWSLGRGFLNRFCLSHGVVLAIENAVSVAVAMHCQQSSRNLTQPVAKYYTLFTISVGFMQGRKQGEMSAVGSSGSKFLWADASGMDGWLQIGDRRVAWPVQPS